MKKVMLFFAAAVIAFGVNAQTAATPAKKDDKKDSKTTAAPAKKDDKKAATPAKKDDKKAAAPAAKPADKK